MDQQAWQKQNLAKLMGRLQPLRNLDDGTLFAEASGGHYVVVTKEEQHICLWLHDEANANTGVIQSELDLLEPLQLVDAYTQAAFLGLLWRPEPQHIFTTGLGGGCLPTAMHHRLPNAVIQCVEADAVVVQVAEQFFGLRTDERLCVAIDDGRGWLEENGESNRYDILFVDAFQDDGNVPHRLTTVEFFERCRSVLSPGGVLIVNLLYLDPHRTARIKTVDAVFDHLYLCAMQDENDLLFAAQQPLPDEAGCVELATRIQEHHRFPFPYVRRVLKLKRVDSDDIEGWSRAPILTDADK